jgi:hypothetical protein
MKTFHLVADCTFEAEDIDATMVKLADHLLCGALGKDDILFTSGKLDLQAELQQKKTD